MLDFFVILSAVAFFASQVWSSASHFVTSDLQLAAKFVIAKVVFGLLALMAIVVVYAQPPVAQLVGILLIWLALLLFWLTVRETRQAQLRAVFTKEMPGSLVQTGPYAYVRHPFYTSYLTYWLGLAFASWSILGAVLFVVTFSIYWRAAGAEEAKFLSTDMAETYREFAATRSRFFPPFL